MTAHIMYDDVVIGAGVLGLAHAYQLSRRGRRVIVLDRHDAATGQTRLGSGWVQLGWLPTPEMQKLVAAGRSQWLSLATDAGLTCHGSGSLLVATTELEEMLLRQYLELHPQAGVSLLSAHDARQKAPVNVDRVRCALWSDGDLCFDPREVMERVSAYLQESLRVKFVWNCEVTKIAGNVAISPLGEFHAKHFWICSNEGWGSLGAQFAAAPYLSVARSQWLRLKPQPQPLACSVANGSLLLHHATFQRCAAWEEVKASWQARLGELAERGFELRIEPQASGEVLVGCSRQLTGDLNSPILPGDWEDAVWQQLREILDLSEQGVVERWYSHFSCTDAEPYVHHRPEEHVTMIGAAGHSTFTFALGVADQLVHDYLYDASRIQMVVFNLTGTLVADSQGDISCLRDALLEFGLQIPLSQIQPVAGWPKLAAIRYLVENSPQHAERLRDQLNMIHASFNTRLKRFFQHDPRVHALAHAEETMAALRSRGIKVALSTTLNRDAVPLILNRVGWKQGTTYDAVICSDEVPRGRPFPDMIQALMKRLGIQRSRHVAKVGDSPADIEEGLHAGCGLVVAVSSPRFSEEALRQAKPHGIVAHVKDVCDLIPTSDQVR